MLLADLVMVSGLVARVLEQLMTTINIFYLFANYFVKLTL